MLPGDHRDRAVRAAAAVRPVTLGAGREQFPAVRDVRIERDGRTEFRDRGRRAALESLWIDIDRYGGVQVLHGKRCRPGYEAQMQVPQARHRYDNTLFRPGNHGRNACASVAGRRSLSSWRPVSRWCWRDCLAATA